MNMSTYGVGRKIYSTKKEKNTLIFFPIKNMFLLENRGNCLHVSEFFVLIFLILPFSCSSMILGFQILNVSIPNMISIWHLVFHFFCHSTILLFNPCFDFCFIILACFLGFWGGCVWFFFLHSSFFLLLSCRSSPWLKQ